MTNSENNEGSSLNKSWMILANIGVLVLFVIIVAGVYFYVVKKGKSELVFPAGINYLSPKTETAPAATAPLYDYTKLAASSDWVTYKGKIYSFSFQHPKALAALTFPNDQSDSVTFKLSNIPPELQLMLNVETISSRDKTLTGKQEEFVRNYWKFFSGLKGLNNMTAITNEKGLKGYKATYVTKANTNTVENFFYMVEDNNDILIHIANIFPADGQVVFNRLINSLEYFKSNP